MAENSEEPSVNFLVQLGNFKPEEESWSAYIERFECFVVCNDIPNEKKVSTLLTTVGNNIYALLRDVSTPSKPCEKSFEELVKLMENQLYQKSSCRAERLKFHRRRQLGKETIPQYLEVLKKIAMQCEFGDNLNDQLYDKLVYGIHDNAIREKLISNNSWTYEIAVDMATNLEMNQKKSAYPNQQKYGGTTRARTFSTGSSGGSDYRKKINLRSCTHCGCMNHNSERCHYKNATCRLCRKTGHMPRICPTKTNTAPDKTTNLDMPDGKKITQIPKINQHQERMSTQPMEAGDKFYENKQYKLALDAYSAAIRSCPDVAIYYQQRARNYMMLNQYQNGLADAKKCLDIDSSFVMGYILSVRCCLKIGNITEAETIMNKFSQIQPVYAELATAERRDLKLLQEYSKNADLAYRMRDYHKVIHYMDDCCKLSEYCTEFQLMKAECFINLEQYQEARKIADDMMHMNPLSADAAFIRGMCEYRQDDIDCAYVCFALALQRVPDHAKSLVMYEKVQVLMEKKENGNIAFEAGRYEESYNLYSEALALDPENKAVNSKLLFNKALSAQKLGRFDESITGLTETLNVDENNWKAIFERGICYMKLGEYEEAILDFDRSLEIHDDEYTRRMLQEAKDELRKPKKKDYYKLFGIDKGASIDEIKTAYKKKILGALSVNHSDGHGKTSDKLKELYENKFETIDEAYQILRDPEKRSQYDKDNTDEFETHSD